MLRKADSPVEGTIKLMFYIIILSIIAIAMCISIITYYCERKDFVQQLRNINYSLSEMRTNIDKIERIDNKLLKVENKVQTAIDRLSAVRNHIDDSSIKTSESLIKNIAKINADSDIKINIKLNTINERLDSIGSNIVVALNEKKEHCEAKNSSKPSKVKNTTKTNKKENNELKTAK